VKTHVSNKRLLKLATFLRTVPKKQFNYNVFIGRGWKGTSDLSCGTKACALGWAATMPAFRKLGLQIVPIHEGSPEAGGSVTLKDGRGAFYSAMEVFGLNFFEAVRLFAPDSATERKATPKQVAKKLEDFVANRSPGACISGNTVAKQF
jgi:hypothetical protein